MTTREKGLISFIVVLIWTLLVAMAVINGTQKRHVRELDRLNTELIETRQQVSQLAKRDFVIRIRGKHIELLDASGVTAVPTE